MKQITLGISETSFSVRYARNNESMKRLLKQIREKMDSDIFKKKEEVQLKRIEYDELMRKYYASTCEYYYSSYLERNQHSSSCSKCAYQSSANKLSVRIYEKYFLKKNSNNWLWYLN